MAFGAPKMGMGLGTATPSIPSVKPVARVPNMAGSLHSAMPKIGLPKVPHLADGGSLASSGLPGIPPSEQDVYHGEGLFHADTAGRTDRLPRSVPADSFVMPADATSIVGQGNPAAGAKILQGMLAQGPYGSPMPRGKRAGGGNSTDGDVSHVLVAGGETLIPRNHVQNVGWRLKKGGPMEPDKDLKAGHKWLRDFVSKTRKYEIERLKKAPKPKS